MAARGPPACASPAANTATATGEGGETNPADNTASAQTTVVAPLAPPTKKPKAKAKARAKPVACYTFSVTPKMISAGKSKTVVVTVRLAGKPVRGAKVVVRGAGILKSGRTNAQGRALIRVTARKPGILRVSVVSKASCATKRVGVVGAFEPPVTG